MVFPVCPHWDTPITLILGQRLINILIRAVLRSLTAHVVIFPLNVRVGGIS